MENNSEKTNVNKIKLEKGFYYYSKLDELFYFSGQYNGLNYPVLEHIRKKLPPPFIMKDLVRVSNLEVEKRLKELKDDVGWLEEKLKE